MLNYIRKGILAREFFSYNDITITLRPLASMELDEAQDAAYSEINDIRIIKTIMDIRLGKVELSKNMPQNPEYYDKIRRFYNTVDYHIAFLAMRDFIKDLTIEDVKTMQYVHEIVDKVLKISGRTKKEIIEFIKTSDGRELAQIIHYYHVPLTDAAWKLTPLQKEFLYWTSENAPKVVNSLDEAVMNNGK